MSDQGDNQYPVVMGFDMAKEPAPKASTQPAPTPMPAQVSVAHAQTELNRARIMLMLLDQSEMALPLLGAASTPNENLRREHLLRAHNILERLNGRIRDYLG